MADGEKRIIEIEEITALTSNDYFVVDSSASGGKTKKYKSTYITDIINNIPELVAEFEPNHYYDRDALVAHEGKVYYHNAPGASYEEFPTGYQFIQIDLTGLLSRLGFGISIQHNSSFTYNKGDYCMEDYILYRCLNDNVTGAWSSSDWERASLGYDLSSIYKPRLDEHDEQIEEALVLGTASGSIASFTDGSTLPMRKLEVSIEPVQSGSGEPSPTNVRPISGWDEVDATVVGKNIFGGLPLANAIVDAGGTLDTANKTVSFTHGNSQVNILENIKLKESTSYTFILTYSNAGNNNCLSLFYKTSGTRYPINLNNSSDTKTTIVYTTSAVTIDKLVLGWVLDANTNIYYEESGLFEGELTASDFEAYNGQTYAIDLDGTRYGGKLEVVSGVLTVDRAYVNLGSLNWALESGIFRLNENIGAKITSDTSAVADMLCEIYKTVSQNAMGSPSTDMCVAGLNWSNGVRVKDSRYTSVADFKTAVSGIKLVYELATPQTIQLTPTEVKTLLATNNIFADTGDILDATYVRNANITINELIRRIENLEG